MKVLITGSSGFVGKETCKVLLARGIDVLWFDLMNGQSDVTDYESLKAAVVAYRPDRILHLAATARFTDADNFPEKAFRTNWIGTENVAKLSQEYHIPVVYASTGTVYMPIFKEMPIDEKFPAGGNSNYGCSKRLGEEAIKRYANPWIILRYGHLYGAEKKYHGLVGGILAKIRAGVKPQIWGGEQTNDFAYVKDIAEANYCALTATWENWCEIYNIGTGV
jgi:UDP-glucose 4-epimerase